MCLCIPTATQHRLRPVVLSVTLLLFPSVAVSLTSVSRSLSEIMQTIQSAYGNVFVSQPGGTYPTYAKSISMGLGIFHLLITGLIFLISIIGLAVMGSAKGATFNTGPLVSSLIFCILVSSLVCQCSLYPQGNVRCFKSLLFCNKKIRFITISITAILLT